MGCLEGGQIFSVPVHFTRLLRAGSDKVNPIKQLGSLLPLESAVGVNGLVWIKAKNATLTLLVGQLLIKLGNSDGDEWEEIFKKFRKGLATLV